MKLILKGIKIFGVIITTEKCLKNAEFVFDTDDILKIITKLVKK